MISIEQLVVKRENLMIKNNIGVISVKGALGFNKPDVFELVGNTDYISLINELGECKNDPNVQGIILMIDTPGGSVAGLKELANVIRDIKTSKPVVAYIANMCASAGVYIAVNCSMIIATSSAQIGSIGSYLEINNTDDESILKMRSEGAIFKNPDTPISDETKEYLQNKLNKAAKDFQNQIIENRTINEGDLNEIFTGKMFDADEALSFGLIDQIMDFNEFIDQI